EKIIRKLKQSNITVNPAKTKVRVRELWKTSSKSKKHIVEEAAGISRATIYRVYNTGSISAKLVVPMAQNFNVNPYYLTGKIDTPGECTDEILIEFLKGLGYEKLLAKEGEIAKPFAGSHVAPVVGTVAVQKMSDGAAGLNANELTLADLHLLMQALLLREKAGAADAVNKAAALRALLLS
ncbi:MAG: hypothetical protein FWD03_08595, partial [Defluviitaleaceae bacterium]|nr:hypothetical protein [Defluviitaleaceae bacterium]